ncbi:hypothetical protein Angca_000588, partial [Angiostrongylus cantonensis]
KSSTEAAQKTFHLGSIPPRIVVEKVSLSLQAPGSNEKGNLTPSDESDVSTLNSSTTCSQLVEQKLQEISQEAQKLEAVALKNADNTDKKATSNIGNTPTAMTDLRGFRLPEQSLQIEVSPLNTKPSPSHMSTRSPQLPSSEAESTSFSDSQRLSNLQAIAEATQRIFHEATRMSQEPPAGSGRGRESLTGRLGKGFHDLTQGSSDRLQRWKTKLQNGGHGKRQKDQSEPPPSQRPSMADECNKLCSWSARHPRPLHSSRSASNAIHVTEAMPIKLLKKGEMDHRTLKTRENNVCRKDLSFHYQHMNSLQNIMNTLDGYTKNFEDNPPPRIMPFSDMKPSNDGIIKPVAFRPITSQNEDPSSVHFTANNRVERLVIRGDSTKSSASMNQIINGHVPRSKTVFQPSTSFTSQKPQENEYDTVPDYNEKEKLSDFGSSISDYGSYHNVRQQSKAPSSTLSSGTHSSGSQLPSPPSTAKKAYPPSGRVSALHVTPSPSDSGIVDYETLIRDKENELRVVRNTMEQNEEIIVKVYQEKERAWKEELEHLRSRLSASEKGENALRAQLAGCQKQTDTMNRTIDGLRDEKTGLLRKCFQLERELMQLKMEMNKPRECEECRQRTHSGPPLKRSLDSDNSLRGEVASLRDEVAILKEALTAQMQVFSDERKKWDRENRLENNQMSVGRDRLI